MSALEAVAADTEARATEDARRRGRVLFWAVVAPYAALDALLVVGQLLGGDIPKSVGSVVRLAIEVFLVWRTLNGSVGARRFLAVCAGVASLVSVLAAFASSGKPIAAAGMGVMALLCIFATWVLGFSKDTSAYLDGGRDEGER